jgi:hypothetical protein
VEEWDGRAERTIRLLDQGLVGWFSEEVHMLVGLWVDRWLS